MQSENRVLKEVLNASMEELPVILRKTFANLRVVQEETLMDILACGAESEFGKKHDFENINSVEEFRNKVPITEYGDYAGQIERMKKGETDLLFNGRTASFVVTSGTTGKAKFIPESPMGELVKKIVGNMRTVEMIRSCPASLIEGNKILGITNLAVYNKTQAGIPVGSASGQAAGADPSTAEKLVVPAAVLSASELELSQVDYLTLLFSAAERNVIALICNNIAHFEILLRSFNDNIEPFINDIRQGTISLEISDKLRAELMKSFKADPARADELEKMHREKGALTVSDLWKNFQFVSCWLSADVGRIARELKYLFPENTMYFDWGYGASEGKFNIPVSPDTSGGLVAAFGYFFEFLPMDGGEPVLLQDTEDNGKYELIITSYSGFYRYNMHDIVRITDDGGKMKSIEFVCKSSDKIVIGGRDFYSADLTEHIEGYEAENNTVIRLYQGKNIDGKLQLYIEPVDKDVDKAGFEAYMKAALAKKGIELAGVEWIQDGYRDSLFSQKISTGNSVNHTKIRVFLD